MNIVIVIIIDIIIIMTVGRRCVPVRLFLRFVIDLRTATAVGRKRHFCALALPTYFSTVVSPPFWDRRRFDGVSAARRFFLLCVPRTRRENTPFFLCHNKCECARANAIPLARPRVYFMAALLWYCDADQRARPAPSTLLYTRAGLRSTCTADGTKNIPGRAQKGPLIIPPSCHLRPAAIIRSVVTKTTCSSSSSTTAGID